MKAMQLRTIPLIVGVVLLAGDTVHAGKRRQPAPTANKPAAAALPETPLFKSGEDSATFQLSEVGAVGKASPELELLFSNENQQGIATLLKDERNKSLKPGLILPADKDAKGIKIRFDAIRFLRVANEPDLARVRLVGPVNEVECQRPVSISRLIDSGKPIPLQFQSVTRTTGVTVTITTDMELQWDDGNLAVNGTRGTIDFSVGRFSPARLFYGTDSDSVKLPDLYGTRVDNNALVRRSLLEPEKL